MSSKNLCKTAKYLVVTGFLFLTFSCGDSPKNQPYYYQQYQPQPTYYAPAPAQPYPSQVIPGSRYYTNPYAIPPSRYGYQYYDSDSYYTPPTYYHAEENPFAENAEERSNSVTDDKQ